MKKTIFAAAVASIAALAAQASTSTTDLKTLAETVTVEGDSAGTYVNVLGTGYAKPGKQWDWSKDVVFDGYVHLTYNAWFEPTYNGAASGDNAWAGIHLTTPAIVHTIRYYARNDGSADAARAIGCRFQGANAVDSNGEFQDPVTLYTIPVTDLDTLTNGWQEVTISDPALLAQAFTYLRVIGSYGGNFAEVEFYGQTWDEATSGTPSAAPQNLTISSVDADTDAVKLTWDAPTEPCRSAKVIRSTAPGGSTFDVTLATLSATMLTYTDSDAARIPGVTYYYRVAFANEDNVGPVSDAVSHRHVVQLERTALTDTTLRAGMSVIGYNWHVDDTGKKVFDGDTTTFADLNADDGDKVNIKIGVDLGAAYVIDTFKIYPRSGEYLYRLNGVVLGASNDSSDWKNGTAISASCGITAAQWYTFETTDKAAYRYVYVMKPNDGDFYGNVAELALYGYTLASSQSVLLAPENAAAEWHGTRAVITWTAGQNAASYQVERKADGGDWTVVEQGLTEQRYEDRPERPTKVGYIYRVASVDGNGGLAYTVSVTPTGTPAASGLAITIR